MREPQFVLLPIIDLDRSTDFSDRALGGIGGSHPSRLSHFLHCAEARVSNVAVIQGWPCTQHNSTSRGDEPHSLSAGHAGSGRSLLGHSACGQTHDSEGYKNQFQAEAPPSRLRPLQQAQPPSVPCITLFASRHRCPLDRWRRSQVWSRFSRACRRRLRPGKHVLKKPQQGYETNVVPPSCDRRSVPNGDLEKACPSAAANAAHGRGRHAA